ncbi:MAG TPA: biopolymer transporter ExbD [Bacteroidales bacterium]|jgi:biopolymer transport protein ExbD|nr:biopolymer transporter ExbD [Bacteroidales bacterium]MDD4234867.1 biopolymer transporter ExbD [Bacteroidales bacterium]MDY0161172.1 biopolymer transporter ExbD [Bacteroidales bacterium]HXK82015.1 biopolymer transporter ExbD [Bacteroidales bacterium]
MPRRETPEINGGSMADIAFLLLIFFLVTTTMDVDTGILRQLPPIPDVQQEKTDIDIKERNIFVVLINAQDKLLVENRFMKVEDLREATKEFIRNELNKETLPEKEPKFIEELNKEIMVPKGVISLQNDRGTSYGIYIEVQNELVAAYNEIRNEAAFEYFGKRSFEDLTENQQEAIKKIYPQRISEAEPKNIGDR